MINQAVEALGIGDELLWEPLRVAPPGAWAGHLPFAFWLAKAVRPEAFVELGTHGGNSYFAFCQGIAATGMGGRAFAVDTWQGDEHAGLYGEDVFADVSAFNDAHFKPFSTLLRTTFDDARTYFADGSIDLLHIDGLHSYEAVRHDFETWRSALSSCAVVVFHDVNVRERGFGVWRLWAELAAQHPSFEFHHSHGLGVLGLGPEQGPALRALFQSSGNAEVASAIRGLFAARGEAFQHRVEVLDIREAAARERDAAAHQLVEQAAAREALQGQLLHREDAFRYQQELTRSVGAMVATKDQLIRYQAEELAARDGALQARDILLHGRDAVIRQKDQELLGQADAQGGQDAVSRAAEALQVQRDEYEARLAETEARAQAATAAAHEQAAFTVRIEQAYAQSTSWRLTAPIRVATRLLRGGPAFGSGPLATLSPLPAPPQDALASTPLAPAPQRDEEAATAPSARDARSLFRSLQSARLDAFLSGNGVLTLPAAGGPPDVSILLVLHNQVELTLGCLESIAAVLPGADLTAEVLLLDNASTDRTSALLGRLAGAAKVIRSHWNMHFLQGVNHLAVHAAGRHLLLLNNDAQLLPGALEAAAAVLDGEASVGAVGGRIILTDGTLQEAGSIIWNDGTCVGYGRGCNPDDPDFMFRRDVDYCSGAFLMTPRAVFERLRHFDPRYAPAYYEETDYCVRLWEAGMRVVFEPAAAILHFEFGSADSSTEALALQQRNLATFRARHAAWLRGQAPPAPGNLLRASRRLQAGARRILMIEDRVPNPELGAGYPRSHRILHELTTEGAVVTFFPMFRHREDWPTVRRIVGPEVQVMIRAATEDLRRFLVSRKGEFEGVLVCRPHNMQALLDAVGPDREALLGHAQLIYDAEAVFARRAILEAEMEGQAVSTAEARSRVAQEVALTQAADQVLSVSAAELDVFQRHGVKSVSLLGHALDVAPTTTPFARRHGFIFFGAISDERAPNADAVHWFVREVLPILRERLGQRDLRLRVAGRVGAESVLALDGDGVDLLGQVPDLAAELETARVMVVPTRFAAGIPLKAHQAAACGVPMVVTDLIREQLGWQPGTEFLVASDAPGFAEACARLHEDEQAWGHVRRAALERVAAECSPERFRQTVREVLAAMPKCPAGVPHPAREGLLPPDDDMFVGRPEEEDASVAVPFSYPPAILTTSPHVAVVCHMFHPEVAAEAALYMRNLPFPADLKLSTDTDDKRTALEAVFASWTQGTVEIRVLPNRGRDIAPKLVGFADAHRTYEYVLHLHSKQSKHADFLAPWRTYLYRTLLGSPAVVRSVFEAFKQVPDLGMVAPQHFEPIRRWLDWRGNLQVAQALAARLGIELQSDATLDFPSGSMFWARTAALRPLVDLDLTPEDFPEEAGQVDGTLAHAIERLYFHLCEAAGYRWLKLADPALLFETRAVVQIDRPEDLQVFMQRHGASLASKRLLRRAEAPPMMVRTPAALLALSG
jgi:GT2 family glycosyltransferase